MPPSDAADTSAPPSRQVRFGKRDVTGEVRQRLDIGVTHQFNALQVVVLRGLVGEDPAPFRPYRTTR